MPGSEDRLFVLIVTDPENGVIAQLVKDDAHFSQVAVERAAREALEDSLTPSVRFEVAYQQMARMCDRFLKTYPGVVAIALAVDGRIDSERRYVTASSTLAHWRHHSLSPRLEVRLRRRYKQVRVYLCTLPEAAAAWAGIGKRLEELPDLHVGAGLLLRQWLAERQ